MGPALYWALLACMIPLWVPALPPAPESPHGKACAEPPLPGPEETHGDSCTLSRSSLHRRTGDLGMSAPSAPVMGLLTSRMTCGRTHSREQVGRDAVEAKGRMGSVWSGPLSREAGTTEQKRQVNAASCHVWAHQGLKKLSSVSVP